MQEKQKKLRGERGRGQKKGNTKKKNIYINKRTRGGWRGPPKLFILI